MPGTGLGGPGSAGRRAQTGASVSFSAPLLEQDADHRQRAVGARVHQVQLQRQADAVDQMLAAVVEVELPKLEARAVEQDRAAGFGVRLDGVPGVLDGDAGTPVIEADRVERGAPAAGEVDRRLLLPQRAEREAGVERAPTRRPVMRPVAPARRGWRIGRSSHRHPVSRSRREPIGTGRAPPAQASRLRRSRPPRSGRARRAPRPPSPRAPDGSARARRTRAAAPPGTRHRRRAATRVALSTRLRISSIWRSRVWVSRARMRDARENASPPSPSVAAISDFVVRNASATSAGENARSSTSSSNRMAEPPGRAGISDRGLHKHEGPRRNAGLGKRARRARASRGGLCPCSGIVKALLEGRAPLHARHPTKLGSYCRVLPGMEGAGIAWRTLSLGKSAASA